MIHDHDDNVYCFYKNTDNIKKMVKGYFLCTSMVQEPTKKVTRKHLQTSSMVHWHVFAGFFFYSFEQKI